VYNGESNANDSYGSNNGIERGGLTYTTGKIGDAFNFNGTTSYVSIPNTSNQLNFTGNFSISTWVMPLVTSAAYNIYFSNYKPGGTHGSGYIFYLDRTQNGLTFDLYSQSLISKYQYSWTPLVNTWYHLTVTRKASTGIKLYINGVEVSGTYTLGNATINPTYQLGQIYNIGSYSNGSGLGNYRQDAVSVWNKELTQSEITELYNSGNGAQYITNDFYKPTTNDALNLRNGTAQGGLTYGVGKVGTAFQFNGTNAYVNLPNNSLNLTGPYSISMWVYFASNPAGETPYLLHSFNSTTNTGFEYRIRAGKPEINLYTAGGLFTSWYASSELFSTSGWYHLILVKPLNQQPQFYVNGVSTLTGIRVSNATVTEVTYTNPVKCSIGNNVTYLSNYMPNGSKIDALNIWNKVLTQSDITELYNSGNGKQYSN
jgi:hypothetical protein